MGYLKKYFQIFLLIMALKIVPLNKKQNLKEQIQVLKNQLNQKKSIVMNLTD